MRTIADMDLKLILKEMILADLKHSQLVFGLANLGLDPWDNHYLGIAELVAKLIGVQNDQGKDRFIEVYLDFMNRSADSHVDATNEVLKMLNKVCLEAILDVFLV